MKAYMTAVSEAAKRLEAEGKCLNDEAMAAQSADIDAVSGATITSRAYVKSLQAILDEAA